MDKGTLLQLHLTDALTEIPKSLDIDVDPTMVFLFPLVIDALADPEADAAAVI